MTAEHNADTEEKAHQERIQLAEQLQDIQQQLQAVQLQLSRRQESHRPGPGG